MSLAFPIVLFVLIFYFLIYRPQKKKQQQHDKMISSIDRGDTVITAGGFFGKVSEILDDSYLIEVADGVKVRILKSSISLKRDSGDIKPKSDRPDRPRRKKRRRPVEENGTKNSAETTETEALNEAEVGAETGADGADTMKTAEGVTSEETKLLIQDESTETSNNESDEKEKSKE